MNFDNYMNKIQIISRLLECANYAEDILNCKEINIEEDFQYICLNSASNYDLVNEVILEKIFLLKILIRYIIILIY